MKRFNDYKNSIPTLEELLVLAGKGRDIDGDLYRDHNGEVFIYGDGQGFHVPQLEARLGASLSARIPMSMDIQFPEIPEEEVNPEDLVKKGIKIHGDHIINHETKEYFCNDDRKPEDCICCYHDKADDIDTSIEANIMNTLCPKHLYKYIY